jgi:hypothetical protein
VVSALAVRRAWLVAAGFAAVCIGVLVVAGSLPPGTAQATPSPAPTTFYLPLPTTGFMDACAGDEWRSRVFLVSTPAGVVGRVDGGAVVKIFWPPGFSAIYDPLFSRVVTESGEVFATAGEDISVHLKGSTWNGVNVCPAGRGHQRPIWRSGGLLVDPPSKAHRRAPGDIPYAKRTDWV